MLFFIISFYFWRSFEKKKTFLNNIKNFRVLGLQTSAQIKWKMQKKKHFISYPLTPYVLCMQVIVVELYQTVHILNNICKFTLWVFSTRICSHFTSPHTDFEVIQYFTKELQSFV